VARNKARAAKLDRSALPEDEQKRLRELKDIKSDYRLPKATTAGDAQDKRKQGPSPPPSHFALRSSSFFLTPPDTTRIRSLGRHY